MRDKVNKVNKSTILLLYTFARVYLKNTRETPYIISTLNLFTLLTYQGVTREKGCRDPRPMPAPC